MEDIIDGLIHDITADANGAHEQLVSFCQAFGTIARFPFNCRVIGVEAEVIGVEFQGNDRRELIAVCRRAGERHSVGLLDAHPAGPLSIETSHLIEAYRRWSGAEPTAVSSPPEFDRASRWSRYCRASISRTSTTMWSLT